MLACTNIVVHTPKLGCLKRISTSWDKRLVVLRIFHQPLDKGPNGRSPEGSLRHRSQLCNARIEAFQVSGLSSESTSGEIGVNARSFEDACKLRGPGLWTLSSSCANKRPWEAPSSPARAGFWCEESYQQTSRDTPLDALQNPALQESRRTTMQIRSWDALSLRPPLNR